MEYNVRALRTVHRWWLIAVLALWTTAAAWCSDTLRSEHAPSYRKNTQEKSAQVRGGTQWEGALATRDEYGSFKLEQLRKQLISQQSLLRVESFDDSQKSKC